MNKNNLMKYTLLYNKDDGNTYFKDIIVPTPHEGSFLGKISNAFPVSKLWYRHFYEGTYDWHTVPQKQFIVYLSDKVATEASSGETRYFGAGDILYATDVNGKGHCSTIIEENKITIKSVSLDDARLPSVINCII